MQDRNDHHGNLGNGSELGSCVIMGPRIQLPDSSPHILKSTISDIQDAEIAEKELIIINIS